jgi:purine-nucleoside phosphorylase
MDIEVSIPYEELPHFPTSTVESHAGRLLFGVIAGRRIVALQGRFHLYEGYTPYDVTLPIRVFGELGVQALVLSNAAGGMNTAFRRGDLMLVSDHINLQGANPLVGLNNENWGPRFPDMSEPYDVELRQIARESAARLATTLHEGVYVAVLGPLLETPAEYRFLHGIGGDAVGMSTVPEVIVARHMGMRVAALSVITDECFPETLQPVDIAEILAAAKSAEPALTSIMQDIVAGC